MISTISEEDGLEYYELYPRAVNAEQFKDFIKKLSKKNEKRDIVIFMDNLRIHKT